MQLSYGDIVKLKHIANRFRICDGEITHIAPVDSGRINNTYKVTVTHADDTTSYMLQRINQSVFEDVSLVMENAIRVTNHLRSKEIQTLEFIYTKDGSPMLDDDGDVYRMTKFIHAEVFQYITRPMDMQMLGRAVGDFALGLKDFDASTLHDTIPDFHNTQVRCGNLILSALRNMLRGSDRRVVESQEELNFVITNKEIFGTIVNALMTGEIPLRVTHNDTKINNVLFDRKTNLPRCMIDLDTVMKGSILYDIADAIRSGANTSSEEERDHSKVKIDLELLREFLVGFKTSAPNFLTPKEIELLPIAISLMPFELGIRFLTDYYDGDKYFGIINSDDNLNRARVQFALVDDITDKIELIEEIVKEIFVTSGDTTQR